MKILKVAGLSLMLGLAGLSTYILVWWFLTGLDSLFKE